MPYPADPNDRDRLRPGASDPMLAQVLSAINDLREEMRTEIHGLRAKVDTMVSKDEIQRYLPRETAEGQRQLTDQRINDVSKRLDATIDQQLEMRKQLHERALAEAQEQRQERKEIDGRAIAIMTTVITLVASPIIYALFNLIQHAVLHP